MKLALLQLNSGADMAANIATVEAMVREAAGAGATFIATPENTFLMEASSSSPHHPSPRGFGGRSPNPLPKGEGVKKYSQENHPAIIATQALAKECGVWILIGSVAVIPSNGDGKCYNRSLLINPEGCITATYNKIHLFDVDVPNDRSYRESDRFSAGDKAVTASLSTINHQPSTTLGMTICYDLRFPHLYRSLAKMGANILAVPAAFTAVTGEAHWHVLLRARAIENGCFVIAPAQTGTHADGRKTYGHSLVVDPWGRVLADGGTEVGIVYADIDVGEVAKVRMRLSSLEHDRPFSFV